MLPTHKRRSAPSVSQRGWIAKQAFSTRVSTDILEELRNCVVALSGPPDRLTVSAFVENALRHELQRLQRKMNAGRRFRKRHEAVRVGRPVGR